MRLGPVLFLPNRHHRHFVTAGITVSNTDAETVLKRDRRTDNRLAHRPLIRVRQKELVVQRSECLRVVRSQNPVT